jgi:hypothetical protein
MTARTSYSDSTKWKFSLSFLTSPIIEKPLINRSVLKARLETPVEVEKARKKCDGTSVFLTCNQRENETPLFT